MLLAEMSGAVDMRGVLPVRSGYPSVRPYPLRNVNSIKWFVVHHTGDGTGRPTALDVATYQTGPTAGFPFPAIAYTLYIDANATIHVCHDIEEEVWSNGVGSPSADANQEGVYNEWTLSCCFSGQDPTDAQWAKVLVAYSAAQRVLGRALQLTGHGFLPNGGTSCPGNMASSRLKPPS